MVNGVLMGGQYRSSFFDSLKCVLIFFVIFGHFIEADNGEGTFLYNLIYCFHMPLFIMISGYFTKDVDGKKLWKSIWKFLEILIVFKIYEIILFTVIGVEQKAFLVPWNATWYLLAIVVYRLIFHYLNLKKAPSILIISISFVLALAAGFVPFFGRELSAQRIFAFLPFFTIGYCLNKTDIISKIRNVNKVYGV